MNAEIKKVEDKKVEDKKVEPDISKLISDGFKDLRDLLKDKKTDTNDSKEEIKTLIPDIPPVEEKPEETEIKKEGLTLSKIWSKVWRGE